MKSGWLRTSFALFLSSILLTSLARATNTEDGLYLCGNIQEFSTTEGSIKVDITSESCHGLNTFKLPKAMNAAQLPSTGRICFFIDSNSCKRGFVYTITKIEKE